MRKSLRLSIFKKKIVAFLSLLFLFVTALLLFPIPGDIPILMYHFTGSEDDAVKSHTTITPQSFKMQMEYIKLFRYQVISMEEYKSVTKKEPAVVLAPTAITSQHKEWILSFQGIPAMDPWLWEKAFQEFPDSISISTLKRWKLI